MVSPIQIVLNPENFEEAREGGGGGPKEDFFAHQDNEFRAHRSTLIAQVRGIVTALRSQPEGDVGYVKVVLRRRAWAKSHRPLRSLFKPDRIPLVGGADLGVMIFEARPQAMLEIANDIAQAEDQTTLRFNELRKKEIPYPSARRSETGAIERIELYGPSDRRTFSVEEAVAWLTNPITGSAYQVQLFEVPPPRNTWDAFDIAHQQLFRSFVDGFASIGEGLSVERRLTATRAQPLLSVRLDQSVNPPMLRLASPAQSERRHDVAAFDPSKDRHAKLLAFLERHPLVRRIELPGIIVRSATQPQRSRPTTATFPTRDTTRSHAKMGIIDGGISEALSDWVIERWDLLADEDVDLAHGTFIGGLSVGGRGFNGLDTCPEPDGAELVDLAVFPNERKAGAFASYFPDGLPQFFDEVSAAITDAHTRHGVRVFNMSLNVQQPAALDQYSTYAARLDEIAEANDSIIFISAGNTGPQDTRAEWPSDELQALGILATARNDEILVPAESVRNVAVGALNPIGLAACVASAPARYSRRGPGLRSGVKPDFAHFGGSGSPQAPLGHGLFSINPDGTIAEGCGTSYAAPLVAKTTAVLDSLIEGNVSRETLIGLLAHHAEIPYPLRTKTLAGVARHLVGFGFPASADHMLVTDDHQITIVIASRIRQDQQINFRFNWPSSLIDANGRCRGAAKLTLVATPPLNARFGSEFVRVNLDAALQQQKADGHWMGRLDSIYLPNKADAGTIEAEQIEHGFKWSPVKIYAKTMPRGVGTSSNWRLMVSYLTRSGEEMPADGVPFTAILTISDPEGAQPVFNDMRQTLTALGVQVADIRTAARITSRI